MGKKTYELEWNNSFSIKIQLDHDKEKDIETIFHQMNNYWSDSEDRLEAYDGNIINVGLKLIADAAFRLIVEGCFGVGHLIQRFKEAEAVCSVNGDDGIEIIDYWWGGLDDFDITIKEIENPKEDK